MNAFLSYLLMTIVSSGVVYVGYLLALRSETFFRFNRIYLLTGVCVSFLLPLAGGMGWLPDMASLLIRSQPVEAVNYGVSNLQTMGVAPLNVVGFSMVHLLWIGYLLVSLLLLFRFLSRLNKMRNLRRKAEVCDLNGYSVCWVTDEVAPFSIFSTIFLSKKLVRNDQMDEIVRHEFAHIREGHTFDILLIECLKVVFWINPFLYLINRSLRETHEFQVDAMVLGEGLDMDVYRTSLLSFLGETQMQVLSNNFNHSLIFRRLSMFTRKSSGLARYKSVIVVPLVLGMVFLYTSACSDKNGSSTKSPSQTEPQMLESTVKNVTPEASAPELDSTVNKAALTTPIPELKSTIKNVPPKAPEPELMVSIKNVAPAISKSDSSVYYAPATASRPALKVSIKNVAPTIPIPELKSTIKNVAPVIQPDKGVQEEQVNKQEVTPVITPDEEVMGE